MNNKLLGVGLVSCVLILALVALFTRIRAHDAREHRALIQDQAFAARGKLADRAMVGALKDAHEILRAFAAYAADTGGPIPPADQLAKLKPFLKTATLDHFVYTPPRKLTLLDAPPDLILGYVETPFGRATVRLDGTAQWLAS